MRRKRKQCEVVWQREPLNKSNAMLTSVPSTVSQCIASVTGHRYKRLHAGVPNRPLDTPQLLQTGAVKTRRAFRPKT
jgi:hypothetical protein